MERSMPRELGIEEVKYVDGKWNKGCGGGGVQFIFWWCVLPDVWN